MIGVLVGEGEEKRKVNSKDIVKESVEVVVLVKWERKKGRGSVASSKYRWVIDMMMLFGFVVC